MLLIVDANILFSSLITKGKTAELIVSPKLKLTAPEYLLVELNENRELLARKTRLSKEEFDAFLGVVMRRIKFVKEKYFSEFLKEAKEISPEEDFPYVALALKLKSLGFEAKIWSNDKELKKALEGKIEVLTTKEILERLRINL
ncbi:MAG: hypothetical protein DRP10_04285 [Candidatus Aenigmatarchaeota archaeon]|nr:MAG: hypothetical protein DRP10_04285 [Candidatus Aenigmarchaeota archaeon]